MLRNFSCNKVRASIRHSTTLTHTKRKTKKCCWTYLQDFQFMFLFLSFGEQFKLFLLGIFSFFDSFLLNLFLNFSLLLLAVFDLVLVLLEPLKRPQQVPEHSFTSLKHEDLKLANFLQVFMQYVVHYVVNRDYLGIGGWTKFEEWHDFRTLNVHNFDNRTTESPIQQWWVCYHSILI